MPEPAACPGHARASLRPSPYAVAGAKRAMAPRHLPDHSRAGGQRGRNQVRPGAGCFTRPLDPTQAGLRTVLCTRGRPGPSRCGWVGRPLGNPWCEAAHPAPRAGARAEGRPAPVFLKASHFRYRNMNPASTNQDKQQEVLQASQDPRPRPRRLQGTAPTGAPARCSPPPRTKWTRLVPHPVLIGHAASQPVHGQRPRAARAGARPRAASRDASRRAERGCARGRSSLRRSRTRTRTGRSWCLTGKAARGRGCGCSGSAREPIHAPGRGHPFSAVGWVWARAVSVASAPPRVILLGRALGRKPQWILQAEATLRQERSAPPDVPLSPAARTRAPRHAGLRG
jgi:hypothetical protein